MVTSSFESPSQSDSTTAKTIGKRVLSSINGVTMQRQDCVPESNRVPKLIKRVPSEWQMLKFSNDATQNHSKQEYNTYIPRIWIIRGPLLFLVYLFISAPCAGDVSTLGCFLWKLLIYVCVLIKKWFLTFQNFLGKYITLHTAILQTFAIQ